MTELAIRTPFPPPQGSEDMLVAIFKGQRELMEKYHMIEGANGSPVIPHELEGDLNGRRVQDRLHQLFGFAIREWGEAMQELPNKPWKQTLGQTDRAAFIDEVGDTLHFFVEFCITAGITPKELHDSYFRMHRKNQTRQSTNY